MCVCVCVCVCVCQIELKETFPTHPSRLCVISAQCILFFCKCMFLKHTQDVDVHVTRVVYIMLTFSSMFHRKPIVSLCLSSDGRCLAVGEVRVHM